VSTSQATVTLSIAVKSYDIDFTGVVSNIAVVRWIEDLRLALGEAVYPVTAMLADGVAPVVAQTTVSYRRPIRFGDQVTATLWLSDVGSVKWVVAATFTVNGITLIEASQTCCFVSTETGRFVRIPMWLRTKLELRDMWLPVPSPAAVKRFQDLLKAEFSLELDMVSATDAATKLLQIHYLLAYAYRDLRPEIDRQRRSAGSKPAGPDS
jgi:acyl-CoA thioester hydrolase